MRSSTLVLATAALAAAAVLAAAGCGTKFPAPTESTGGFIPPDDSYTFKGSLTGVSDVTDVLITRSSGNQVLVARGALPDERPPGDTTPLPDGVLELYPIFPQAGTPPLSIGFDGLRRPQLVAENGGRLFVLDAGDTNALSTSPDSLPRVVGYQIGDPTPLFSFGGEIAFTPERQRRSWAEIRGIAVSDDRTVYVSGTFYVRERDQFDRFSWVFRDAIWRYKESSPGVYQRDSLDVFTPWEVPEGTGTGFVSQQRGIAWGPAVDPHLWVVDGEKQSVQKLRIEADPEAHGIYQFDGTTSGERFLEPVDVAVDEEGFLYVVDRGSDRVLRFQDDGAAASFVQKVNLGILQGEPALVDPSAAAVLDTIVYVADPPSDAARRYERRRQ